MAKQFICNYDYPVAETKAGKLRGFLDNGIFTFHGVQYADADRFQSPRPVEHWEGVKNATNYGYICPVMSSPAPSSEIFIPHRFWPSNEHCQNLNIWTPGINDGKRRPVMVWFHGGGFSSGSAIEQVAYEGDRLAKYGDVVVVTVNHRLNILGYLDMSAYGEKYANSVNAGVEDLVVALKWVRDNIAGFGGDPDNVTIFGQSGGGGKVQVLLQVPEAAGLFHKAIMMSGILPQKETAPADYKKLTDCMLANLDLSAETVEKIEKVPYEVLVRAYQKATAEVGFSAEWNPQPNHWYPGDPMKIGFSDYAKTVPCIAGTTVCEFGLRSAERNNALSDEELTEALRAKFGKDTDAIIDEFHIAYPGKRLALLDSFDAAFRPGATAFMEKKAAESSVPGYVYTFALEFPVVGGAYAWHCSDIPFVFHNSERVPNCNIEGVTERLEDQMAGAWVSFAYTGNPNHAGLAKWEPYGEKKATMVFDRESKCREDYDTALFEKIVKASHPSYISPAPAMNDDKAKREWLY